MTTRIQRQLTRLESRLAHLGPHRAAVVSLAKMQGRRRTRAMHAMRDAMHAIGQPESYAALVREVNDWRFGTGPALPRPHRRLRQMPRR